MKGNFYSSEYKEFNTFSAFYLKIAKFILLINYYIFAGRAYKQIN